MADDRELPRVRGRLTVTFVTGRADPGKAGVNCVTNRAKGASPGGAPGGAPGTCRPAGPALGLVLQARAHECAALVAAQLLAAGLGVARLHAVLLRVAGAGALDFLEARVQRALALLALEALGLHRALAAAIGG